VQPERIDPLSRPPADLPVRLPDEQVELAGVKRVGPFEFQWPGDTESFEGGWTFEAHIDGAQHSVRLGIGAREAFGRLRVHAVTWIDGRVQVEGAEADHYPATQVLISRLRRPGGGLVRTWAEIPAGYDDFEIVEHRREIDAPHTPQCLAVKIREDDLASWAVHAWLHSKLRKKPPSRTRTLSPVALPPQPELFSPPATDAELVGRALLAHADAMAGQLKSAVAPLTYNQDADALVRSDPFAFLLAVISAVGIRAERAWALPYELRRRLGYLSPAELADNPGAVRVVVRRPPQLHRFVNTVPNWLVEAARIVLDRYDGDAARLWSDAPTAVELRRRIEEFPGMGQKKAAMAVQILARDLGKPLSESKRSDAHTRRVFLRTGLVDRGGVRQIAAVARHLYPDLPGALDLPAWDIGRRWCWPTNPDCPACPLNCACARLID
jgi:uncharacterized HhH-GPD family protein